jgi:hypothetical protein
MVQKVFIKGTVSRDFLPLVFFFKQLLLAPVDKPSNDFDFFRIYAEISDYFGASPVSTTPTIHALPVSLTPVNNSSPVSTTPVSDTFTVLKSFTGVYDIDNACIAGVIDTGKDMHSPVSMTPAMHVVDTVDAPVGPLAVRECI